LRIGAVAGDIMVFSGGARPTNGSPELGVLYQPWSRPYRQAMQSIEATRGAAVFQSLLT